jgi:hypothetical protein
MNPIHIIIRYVLANTDAAAILMNFASPLTILLFGMEFKISISAGVKTLPLLFYTFFSNKGLFPSTMIYSGWG